MRIVKRNGAVMAFDISKIKEAISKAEITEMEQRIIFRIEKSMCAVGYAGDFEAFASAYLDLQNKKCRIRFLRRMKNERIRVLLKLIWMRRNSGVGRSSTSNVSDQLLLTIPTHPTAETVKRSLWQRGITCESIA